MVPNTAPGHYFFSLREHTSLNRMEVGYRALALSELQLEGFPLPAAFVVSQSFLQAIAEANQLFTFLEKIFSTPHWNHPEYIAQESANIQKHILNFKVPEKLVPAFTQSYTRWWEDKFFAIRPSFIYYNASAEHLSELHVQGEANLLESLLKVWARMYQIHELPLRAQEWKMGLKIPAALVFQEMVTATSSGWAVTEKQRHRRHVSVFSQWGVTEFQPNHQPQLDHFEIDLKERAIVHRHIQVKKHQYTHHHGKLEQVLVAPSKQAAPSLTEAEAIEVAELVERAQQKQLEPTKVEWAATPTKVFILDIRPLTEAANQPRQSAQPQRIAAVEQTAAAPLAVVATLDSLAKIPQGGEHAEAVAILHPEEVFYSYGINPFRFLEKNKGAALTGYIKEVLVRLHQKFPHQAVFYYTHNFPSTYFAPLEDHTQTREENPEFGYRGAIQMLHNYGLLDHELDAINEVIRQTHAQYRLVLPFVRTAAELSIILKHLEKKLPQRSPELEIWIKTSTVENVMHIDQYARQHITGIILDLPQLYTNLYGLDPTNDDLLKLYAPDASLLQWFMQYAKEKTHQLETQLFVDMGRYQSDVLEASIKLHYDGVCCRPQDVLTLKHHAHKGS